MQCHYVNGDADCRDTATEGHFCFPHALAFVDEGNHALTSAQRARLARSHGARYNALERAASVEKTPELHNGGQGTTRAGRPCGFNVADGVGYCINHFPGNDTSAAAQHAARSPRRRPEPHRLLEAVLSLNDRESIQAALDAVTRPTLSGHIDTERAAIVLRACAIATRNFNPIMDTIEGPQPPSCDRRAYYHRVESLLLSISPLLDTPELER